MNGDDVRKMLKDGKSAKDIGAEARKHLTVAKHEKPAKADREQSQRDTGPETMDTSSVMGAVRDAHLNGDLDDKGYQEIFDALTKK